MNFSRASILYLLLQLYVGLQIVAFLSSKCFLATPALPVATIAPTVPPATTEGLLADHQKHFNSLPVNQLDPSILRHGRSLQVIPHPATYFQEVKPVSSMVMKE